MSDNPDNPLDNPPFRLHSGEAALNVFEDLMSRLQAEADRHPIDECPLTSATYRSWDRKLMMRLGMAEGALLVLQARGDITPEQYMKMKMKVLAFTVRRSARVQLGGPG